MPASIVIESFNNFAFVASEAIAKEIAAGRLACDQITLDSGSAPSKDEIVINSACPSLRVRLKKHAHELLVREARNFLKKECGTKEGSLEEDANLLVLAVAWKLNKNNSVSTPEFPSLANINEGDTRSALIRALTIGDKDDDIAEGLAAMAIMQKSLSMNEDEMKFLAKDASVIVSRIVKEHVDNAKGRSDTSDLLGECVQEVLSECLKDLGDKIQGPLFKYLMEDVLGERDGRLFVSPNARILALGDAENRVIQAIHCFKNNIPLCIPENIADICLASIRSELAKAECICRITLAIEVTAECPDLTKDALMKKIDRKIALARSYVRSEALHANNHGSIRSNYEAGIKLIGDDQQVHEFARLCFALEMSGVDCYTGPGYYDKSVLQLISDLIHRFVDHLYAVLKDAGLVASTNYRARLQLVTCKEDIALEGGKVLEIQKSESTLFKKGKAQDVEYAIKDIDNRKPCKMEGGKTVEDVARQACDKAIASSKLRMESRAALRKTEADRDVALDCVSSDLRVLDNKGRELLTPEERKMNAALENAAKRLKLAPVGPVISSCSAQAGRANESLPQSRKSTAY